MTSNWVPFLSPSPSFHSVPHSVTPAVLEFAVHSRLTYHGDPYLPLPPECCHTWCCRPVTPAWGCRCIKNSRLFLASQQVQGDLRSTPRILYSLAKILSLKLCISSFLMEFKLFFSIKFVFLLGVGCVHWGTHVEARGQLDESALSSTAWVLRMCLVIEQFFCLSYGLSKTAMCQNLS